MKKDHGLIFRLFLILGDIFAIVFSFGFAYFIRTHIDNRPYFFDFKPREFILSIIFLIPVWIIIIAIFGLYQKSICFSKNRASRLGRLFIVSIVGTMAIITYDFFGQTNLFPVRVVAIYAALLCFISLTTIRTIICFVRNRIMQKRKGLQKAIIIGNSKNTEYLADYIAAFPETGYKIAAIVASKKYIPKELRKKQYSSLKEAIKKTRADVIFQTDECRTEYTFKQSIYHHMLYYFIPSETVLSSNMGELELIGNTPATLVKTTPLIGNARIIKRLFDIVFGTLALIIAAIPMLVIWILIKCVDFKSPAIYSDTRLSRYNKRFTIYKFRTMKPEYSGLSPEEAFTKMGKPELIKKYRENGDFLEKDPRITKIGRFLRATSLDELPQLLNVVKGDISLVGPRALVPGELRDYGDRSLLLSVKSGLTGLAQVSGRRNISFEERRALDIYYIQNWSLWLDFQIIFRTIASVFKREGAK